LREVVFKKYNCAPSDLDIIAQISVREAIKNEMKAERRTMLGQLLIDKGPKALTRRQKLKLGKYPEEVEIFFDQWILNLANKYVKDTSSLDAYECSILNNIMLTHKNSPKELKPFDSENIVPLLLSIDDFKSQEASQIKVKSISYLSFHVNKCIEYYNLKRYTQAVFEADFLEQNEELFGDEICDFKGMAPLELTEYEETIYSLNKTLSLEQCGWHSVIITRGFALMELGEYESALIDFKRSLKTNFKRNHDLNHTIHIKIAICLTKLTRYDEALEFLNKILIM